MFIGRIDEVKEIKLALDTDKFESILIYGRRRVGKSEIIHESIKEVNLPIINFECKKSFFIC